MRYIVALLVGGLAASCLVACRHQPTLTGDPWLMNGPREDTASGFARIASDRVLYLQPQDVAPAVKRLASTSVVSLTMREYEALCPIRPEVRSGRLRPYLVRCVTEFDPAHDSDPRVYGDVLWMSSGTLSHDDVQLEHTAVVVLLPTPPKQVLVTYSVAE